MKCTEITSKGNLEISSNLNWNSLKSMQLPKDGLVGLETWVKILFNLYK